ncbi:unnamed protein product [Schistosoma turkestanicum]|nr:unnamed protein product [Schistosoma turkestanicum]
MFDFWKRLNPSTLTVEEAENKMFPGMSSISMSSHRSTREEETIYEETLVDGSYRTDRLHDTWMPPNMSRLPLGSSKFNSSSGLSSRSTISTSHSIQPMSSRLSSKAGSPTMLRTSISENIEEDVSSRYSDFSSNNSSTSESRLLRSTAKKFKNERIGFRKLVSREFQVAHDLRGGNSNTNNLRLHDQQKESIITPIERARGPRKSERIASKNQSNSQQSLAQIDVDTSDGQETTSPSLSLTSTYIYPSELQSTLDPMIMSSKASQQSNQVYSGAGSSVTKNYDPWSKRISSIWGRLSNNNLSSIDSNNNFSFNDTRPHMGRENSRGWLARHMFGLERETAEDLDFESKNIENQFLSSDVEDNYDTTIPFNKTKNLTKRNKTLFHSNLPRSNSVYSDSLLRQSRLCFYIHCVLNSLRNMSIHCVAFLMAFIYSVGNIFLYILSCLPRLSRRVFAKLFSRNDDSSASLNYQSRLRADVSRLQAPKGSFSSYTQRNDFTQSRQENSWNWCLHLVLPLLILLPLLLFVSFLFTPIDYLSDNSSLKLSPFLSDSNCVYELSEPRPNNTHLWNLFLWRTRCLYVRYFLSSKFNEENSSSDWWSWIPLYSSSKSNDQMIFDTGNLSDETANKLIEKLASLSQSVNRRLDLLSQTIKATDDRLINLKQDSIRKYDLLNLELIEMKNIFHHHVNEWNHFYLIYNQSNTTTSPSRSLSDDENFSSTDHNEKLLMESDRLLNLANEAAKHNIATQLNELRNEILQDLIKSDIERNMSLANMSMLLSNLHSQLGIHSKQTQDEFHKLHSQFMSMDSDRSKKFIDFENNLLQLQNQINILTPHMSGLEKLNEESKSTFMYIQNELKKCVRNEEIKNYCSEAVIEEVNVAITNLSQSFSTQIKEIVYETIIGELRNSNNMDSTLLAYIRQTVSTLVKESVDKLVYNHQLEPVPHSLENKASLVGMIDEALHRFAADRTGLPDYALESSGGSVVGTRCTKTYTKGASLLSIFGLPLARLSNSPRTILQPGNNPGDCWPFEGSKGQVIIRLSSPIIISSVTLEHLPKELSPNGRLDSAPRDFLVKALQSEYDEDGLVLGEFTYDVKNRPIQNFPTKEYLKPIQYVELVILNNHGHSEYTCIYRFRVHGRMIT